MTKKEREEKEIQRLKELLLPEKALWAEGKRYIAGVDEVGRGPLAGPVVAAAVILPWDFNIPGVDDSKKLSEKRRIELYYKIKEAAIAYAIGRREPERIDSINILEATKEAMTDAVLGLRIKPDYVLTDAVVLKDIDIKMRAMIKGDAASISIAAASIIAKVTRDMEMIEMDRIYPGYSFAKNKGYGTKAHYEGLKA